MNTKNIKLLKALHFVLMAVTFVLTIISLIKNSTDSSIFGTSSLTMICTIANLLALACGFIYLFKDYKKEASTFYKLFLVLLAIEGVLRSSYFASLGVGPKYTIPYNTGLVITVILAVSKDLGKKNTNIIAVCLIICRLYTFIHTVSRVGVLGTAKFAAIVQEVSILLLAGSTYLMAVGKYLDKDSRGAK